MYLYMYIPDLIDNHNICCTSYRRLATAGHVVGHAGGRFAAATRSQCWGAARAGGSERAPAPF